MAITETEIIWTTLPNGFTQDGKLRFSVFLTPRLTETETGTGTLGDFNTFADWPKTVAGLIERKFSLHDMDADQEIGPAEIAPVKPGWEPMADPSIIWQTIFPEDTPVESFPPDEFEKLKATHITLSPASVVLERIKQPFVKFGIESPKQRPLIKQFFDPTSPIPIFEYAKASVGPSLVSDTAYQDLNKMHDFLHLSQPAGAKTRSLSPPAKEPNLKDFHHLVSMLGEYPIVLRWLRLVLDFELTLPDAMPPSGRIGIANPAFNDESQAHHRIMGTRYTLDRANRRFLATPKDTNLLRNGYLNLNYRDPSTNATTYKTIETDVEGGFIKFTNFAVDQDARLQAGADSTTRSGLPALRSAGLAIAQTGRDDALTAIFNRADELNTKQDTSLDAEDLIRGYRVDVYDSQFAGGKWFSLCERLGEYRVANVPAHWYRDEGCISTALTKQTDEHTGESINTLNESLFHWEGWSLSVARPGRAIQTGANATEPAINIGIDAEFRVPAGTLPRQRYGASYRFRLRTVDLAGNSLDLEGDSPDSESNATPLIPMSRFEPVGSPTLASLLAAGEKFGPGESMDHLVIHSSDLQQPTSENTQRHIAPPKVAQSTAELHGMFDDAQGLRKDAYQTIISHDAALPDRHAGAHIPINYLPDPLARGVAFRDLPTAEGEVLLFGFNNLEHWPDITTIRLQLEEGDGPPLPDHANNLLRVFLPKGRTARVRLSCCLMDSSNAFDDASKLRLEKLGLWRWFQNSTETTDMTELGQTAMQGMHWMLTPDREIELVHAVAKPLAAPSILLDPVTPRKDKTKAILNGSIRLDGASTSKVDVWAEWLDPIDDPNDPNGPRLPAMGEGRRSVAHVAELPVTLDGKPSPVNGGKIKYDSQHDQLKLGFEREGKGGHRVITFKAPHHDLGDTRYHKLSYCAVAATRFREYFPPLPPALVLGTAASPCESAEAQYTRKGQPLTDVIILNSARPDAPRIAYVMPTFAWQQQSLGGDLPRTHTRRGGGLRVYLERPWYSSGDGELLGVVVLNDSASDTQLQDYVSQWAQDPLWHTDVNIGDRRLSLGKLRNFPAGNAMRDVPLAEANAMVAVAGYEVQFDRQSGLLYADIEIDATLTYFPFVRLALVRLQPHSIPGAHISKVTLAEFAQLVPNRSVSVSAADTSGRRFTVVVTGVAGERSFKRLGPSITGPVNRYDLPLVCKDTVGPWTSIFEVSIQQRDPAIQDATLGWIDISTNPIELTAQPGIGARQWSGLVTLPVPRGSRQFRLMIKEYEPHGPDGYQHEEASIPAGYRLNPKISRRLVFADAIPL